MSPYRDYKTLRHTTTNMHPDEGNVHASHFLPEEGLGWRWPYISNTGRRELRNKLRRSSREGWLRIGPNTIYSLRSCCWTWMRMSIMISSHCTQLDYYSMQITW